MGSSSDNTFILVEESAVTSKSFCIEDKWKVSLRRLATLSDLIKFGYFHSDVISFASNQRGNRCLNAGNMIKLSVSRIYVLLLHGIVYFEANTWTWVG